MRTRLSSSALSRGSFAHAAVVALTVGLLSGAVVNSTPAAASMTTASPAGNSSAPVVTASTFTLTLPQGAKNVTRTADSQNEELRFSFAGLEAAVFSAPLTPGGMSIAQYVGNYARPGVRIEPTRFGAKKGFLVGQPAGASTALMAVVGLPGRIVSLQLVGRTNSLPRMRVALVKLATSLSPR